MLTAISIKNIALIKKLNLDFSDGLNILSGETGAGKSIIIDSLNFVLGERADKTLIRHGENVAEVEASFYFGNNKNATVPAAAPRIIVMIIVTISPTRESFSGFSIIVTVPLGSSFGATA